MGIIMAVGFVVMVMLVVAAIGLSHTCYSGPTTVHDEITLRAECDQRKRLRREASSTSCAEEMVRASDDSDSQFNMELNAAAIDAQSTSTRDANATIVRKLRSV